MDSKVGRAETAGCGPLAGNSGKAINRRLAGRRMNIGRGAALSRSEIDPGRLRAATSVAGHPAPVRRRRRWRRSRNANVNRAGLNPGPGKLGVAALLKGRDLQACQLP
jgi:hypothetical protein